MDGGGFLTGSGTSSRHPMYADPPTSLCCMFADILIYTEGAIYLLNHTWHLGFRRNVSDFAVIILL